MSYHSILCPNPNFDTIKGEIDVCCAVSGEAANLLPGRRWPSGARTEEERRNLKCRKKSVKKAIIQRFRPHSSSAPVCALGLLPPGGSY